MVHQEPFPQVQNQRCISLNLNSVIADTKMKGPVHEHLGLRSRTQWDSGRCTEESSTRSQASHASANAFLYRLVFVDVDKHPRAEMSQRLSKPVQAANFTTNSVSRNWLLLWQHSDMFRCEVCYEAWWHAGFEHLTRRNISYILKVIWNTPAHREALNAEARFVRILCSYNLLI